MTHTVITLDILLSINVKGQINITVVPTMFLNLLFKLIIKILNYYCSKLTLLIGFKHCDHQHLLPPPQKKRLKKCKSKQYNTLVNNKRQVGMEFYPEHTYSKTAAFEK